MFSFKDTFTLLLGISLGSLLYVVLNFIPFFGPFLAGVSAGKISRGGIKNGFLAGFFSGVIGSLLVFFIFSHYLSSWPFIGKFFVGALLLLWNFVGILLTSLGGTLGATFLVERSLFTKKKQIKSPREEEKITTFVVCKNCKTANPKDRKNCSYCGEKL